MTKIYKFCQFTLTEHSNLVCDENIINLPPKEFLVLRFLLENAGSIVDKEMIIDAVWDGETVSDESLTRCIYVIRRVLGQDSDKRFIETVYGRGYRFIPRVEVIHLESEYETSKSKKGCCIAAFPFVMSNPTESAMLHEYMLKDLHQIANISHDSVHIIPSLLTRFCKEYAEMSLFIKDNGVDYYISGIEIKYPQDTIISLELVRASDHFVMIRESMTLTGNVNIDILTQRNLVIDFCKHLNINLLNHQYMISDDKAA